MSEGDKICGLIKSISESIRARDRGRLMKLSRERFDREEDNNAICWRITPAKMKFGGVFAICCRWGITPAKMKSDLGSSVDEGQM